MQEPQPGAIGWGAPLVVFVLALVLIGVPTARHAQPRHEAAAEHLNGARSLAAGRGFQSTAVGHYLAPVTTLPAPSHTRAMPLTSVVHAPFVAGGDRSARISVVLWTALAAALVCAFASGLLRSPVLGAACGVAFACLPPIQEHGTTTDASVVFVALTLAVFLLYGRLAREPKAPGPALGLGLLAGLSALTQPEAIVSVPVACALVAALARRRRLLAPTARQWGWAAGAFVVVVLPWSVRCLVEFGTLWSPGFGPALASGSLADLVAREHPPTWGAFAQRLAADPALILRGGVATLASTVRMVVLGLGSWTLAGMTVAGAGLLVGRPGPARAMTIAAVAHVVVFAGVEAALGSPTRVLVVAAPLILVAAAAPFAWVVERHGPGSLAASRLDGLVLAGVVTAALAQVGQQAVRAPTGPQAGAELEVVERFLIRGDAPAAMPMITDRPHLYLCVTGRPALALTSDGIPANLRLARAFTTKLVLLRPAGVAGPGFAELAATYAGRRPHRAFDLVLVRGELKLYRVHPSRGEDD